MTCNVGGADKTVRFVIGAALVVVGLLAPLAMVWKAVAFALAGIAVVTALVGFCPLNKLLGIDTCRKGAGS